MEGFEETLVLYAILDCSVSAAEYITVYTVLVDTEDWTYSFTCKHATFKCLMQKELSGRF